MPMRLVAIPTALVRPRIELERRAREGVTTPVAASIVVGSGVVTAAVQLAAGAVEPSGQAAAPSAAVTISLLLPVLLLGFWIAASALVDVAARLMGRDIPAARYRRLSAFAFPALVGNGLVTLAQASVDRASRGSGGMLSQLLGILGLVILLWFIALQAVAASVVYDLSALNAAVAAVFPYAALSGIILLLVVVLSILHAVGAT